MELEGKITMVMPSRSGTSQRTGNAWMSQEYLMDYYWWPNQTIASRMLIKVFGKDRIEQYNLQEGDEVKIRFHVEANEYNGRWYNDTRVDGVTFVGASEAKNHPQAAQGDATAAQSATVAQPTTTKEKEPQKPQDAGDDLPF